jgi:hypothetical protein
MYLYIPFVVVTAIVVEFVAASVESAVAREQRG